MNGYSKEEKGQRILKLVNLLSKNPNAFAKEIGTSSTVIQKAIKQGIGISPNLVQKITQRFQKVNPDWVLSGQGEMFLSEKKTADPPPPIPSGGLLKLDASELMERLEKLEGRIGEQDARIAALEKRLDQNEE